MKFCPHIIRENIKIVLKVSEPIFYSYFGGLTGSEILALYIILIGMGVA